VIPALDKLGSRIDVGYVAPVRRKATSFWRWWRGELVALLPESLQRAIEAGSERLFVQVSGPELVVFQGSVERMQEIARCPIDDDTGETPDIAPSTRPVVLLLPPDAFLQTIVTLPAATEENLHEVLAFEMDRLTPFRAEQVYYGFEVIGRQSRESTIEVLLLATPRPALDRLLAALTRLRLDPDLVTAKADGGGLHDLNLLPDTRVDRRRHATKWLNGALAALLLLLVVTAVAVPIVQKQRLIAILEPQVAAATEAAKEGNALRQSIETIATGSQQLLQRKDAQPMTLTLIDELSRIIPDDTWLSRIDIAGTEVQIQGQSKSAEALIGLVENSPLFENARFRSPVTQVPRTDEERFHLSADWVREAKP